MRSLVYKGPNELKIEDKSKPQLKSGEVLIKVKYCGICGSDITIWKGKHPRAKSGVILGHEFTGEIVEMYDVNSNLCIGDKVVVEPLIHCHRCNYCKEGKYNLCNKIGLYGIDENGAFAEYVKVLSDKVIPLSPSTDLKKMTLIEPLAVVVNAVSKSNIKLGDTVVILGAGPIGLLIAQVARDAGAAKIIVSEINESRLKRAKKLGFIIINPQKEDVEKEVKKISPKGADLVFDVAGHPSVVDSAFKIVKKGGEINVVAIYTQELLISLQKLAYSELIIKGTFIYTWEDFYRAKILLEKDLIDSKSIITHIFPFEDSIKGFEMMKKGFDGIKILIEI